MRPALFLAATALAACSSSSSGGSKGGGATDGGGDAGPRRVTAAPDGEPWKTLSEWHLFTDAAKQAPSERVVPYDVNSQLYADYAAKYRFLHVPEGEHIEYQPSAVWGLPVGTILVKTFSYWKDARDPSVGERLLETRLLLHEADGWVPLTYVWNAEQTEATLERSGTVIDSQFIDPSGMDTSNQYVVPSGSDCRLCHGKLGVTNTLGGRTRQLDRTHDYGDGEENQIDHLAKLGFFASDPEPEAARERLVDPMDTSADLYERVRAYFDGNCGHCHQPGDAGGSLSGFWLDYPSTAPAEPDINWGLCKQPTSAGGGTCGRSLDVVPGQPDESILTCRLEGTAGNVRMPPLGRNLVHAEGVALIREWITGLSGTCGTTTP